MSEKKYTRKEMIHFSMELSKQFNNYYRMYHDEMTWTDKLFYENIRKMVQEGFDYVLMQHIDEDISKGGKDE